MSNNYLVGLFDWRGRILEGRKKIEEQLKEVACASNEDVELSIMLGKNAYLLEAIDAEIENVDDKSLHVVDNN